MASRNEAHRRTVIGAEILSRVALKSHQVESALAPQKPIADLVSSSGEFIDPPVARWSLEPELAEAINERLGKAVRIQIA